MSSKVDARLLSLSPTQQSQQNNQQTTAPVETAPSVRPLPSWEGRMLRREEQSESKRFYESIGFSKFAGKYEPFDIPSGMSVANIAETPTGLQITFKSTRQRTAMISPAKDYQYTKRLTQMKTVSPQEPSVIRTERIHSSHAAEFDPSKELVLPHGAHTFYLDIGYPQYQDKYEPFDLPKGMMVDTIKETKEGLDITLKPMPRTEVDNRSIAERMMDVKFEIPEGGYVGQFLPRNKLVYPLGSFRPETTVRPLAFAAGFVASGENLAYSLAQLRGMETPSIPSTFISDTIGLATGTSQLSRNVERYGRGNLQDYYLGSGLGDILISYGIGKVISKAVVKPLSETSLGKEIGYQFKVHAPKPLLRLAYGKAGAEYIVAERQTFFKTQTLIMGAEGQVLHIPDTMDKNYLRDLFTTEGGGGAEDFPLLKTRGKSITPMSKTLSKALGQTDTALRQSNLVTLVPIPRTIATNVPITAIEFGVTPISESMEMGIGTATKLGLTTRMQTQSTITRMKTRAETIPSRLTRMKQRSSFFNIPQLKANARAFQELEVEPISLQRGQVRQAQAQMIAQPLRTIQKLQLRSRPFSDEFPLRKRKRKMKGDKYAFIGRYRRQYPLATPEDIRKMMIG